MKKRGCIFEGSEQLIDYILTNWEAVLQSINVEHKKSKLEETDEIYLLVMNFKKHMRREQLVRLLILLLEYTLSKLGSCHNCVCCREKGTMKFWFNRMQVRGIKNCYDKLKSRFKDKDKLSNKAMW